jgi:hypothetical protein
MKPALLILPAILFLGLAACDRQDAPASSAATMHAEPTPTDIAGADGVRQPSRQASPEEIAEIEASGRTGLWSDINEVCMADARKGIRATLFWNVKDSGAERVIVFAVDRTGKEKNFGQGGPVGRKQTGPWLRPGVSFKIRAADTRQELGTVLIGEKPC